MPPLTLDTFPPEVISDMVAFTSDELAALVAAEEDEDSDAFRYSLALWEEWAV